MFVLSLMGIVLFLIISILEKQLLRKKYILGICIKEIHKVKEYPQDIERDIYLRCYLEKTELKSIDRFGYVARC